MAKKVVTHNNPDLDAITSVWLIVRWLAGWEEAEFAVVPAGQTYQGQPVDKDPDILHVDTGLGKLDHHQTDAFVCAALLAFDYISSVGAKTVIEVGREKVRWDTSTMKRLVDVVNQVDHFQEVYWAESEADYLEFLAEAILDGWKLIYREEDEVVIDKGLELLDAVYVSLLSKTEAEKILQEKGRVFTAKWGRSLAVETANAHAIVLAQKRGFKLTVSKHPVEQHVKIKSPPPNYLSDAGESIDLTPVYEALRAKDPDASWYLHASKTMVLNGSAKNPQMKPTKLSLDEVVQVIKSLN